MFLVSGPPGFAARTLPKIRRVTTYLGVQRHGGILNTEGQAPSGAHIVTNPSTCPGVDGGPSVELPGEDREDQSFVWKPLDLVLLGSKSVRLDRKLSFTQPRGKLGEKFDVKRRFAKKDSPPPDSPRREVLEDRHDWKITFTPCPNPKTTKRC